MNAGPKKGIVAAAAVTTPDFESLLDVAANKLRLKKKDAKASRLFVWNSGLEVRRGEAGDGLRDGDIIAVSLGEEYSGKVRKPPPDGRPSDCPAHAAGTKSLTDWEKLSNWQQAVTASRSQSVAAIARPPLELGRPSPGAAPDIASIASHLGMLCAAQQRRVVVMVGAGISVSAGIPDFRSPDTGLYANLAEYGLPFAEAIFDIDYFRSNPRPFYKLCSSIWPGTHAPTDTHRFIRLLHDKGVLLRCFTQNIDSLENAAGVPADAIVAAHGNFDSASVIDGGGPVPVDELREALAPDKGEAGWRELRRRHGGLVKPDIVFFGEDLPPRFNKLLAADFSQCALLLVLGTSLAVEPFASLITRVHPRTPRMLINRERVGERGVRDRGASRANGRRGFEFGSPASNDVLYQGDCDAGVQELVQLLGWGADFDTLRDG